MEWNKLPDHIKQQQQHFYIFWKQVRGDLKCKSDGHESHCFVSWSCLMYLSIRVVICD